MRCWLMQSVYRHILWYDHHECEFMVYVYDSIMCLYLIGDMAHYACLIMYIMYILIYVRP